MNGALKKWNKQSSKIKPCIYCGSSMLHITYNISPINHKYFLSCNICNFRGDGARTSRGALRKWNNDSRRYEISSKKRG